MQMLERKSVKTLIAVKKEIKNSNDPSDFHYYMRKVDYMYIWKVSSIMKMSKIHQIFSSSTPCIATAAKKVDRI